MKPTIIKVQTLKEYLTPEGCYIYENWGLVSGGDSKVSIARARVKRGVTTKAHHLDGIQEIYLITQGTGKVQVGDFVARVVKGDTVVIPPSVSQSITNVGKTDLVFYCICTPAFKEACYRDDEAPA